MAVGNLKSSFRRELSDSLSVDPLRPLGTVSFSSSLVYLVVSFASCSLRCMCVGTWGNAIIDVEPPKQSKTGLN